MFKRLSHHPESSSCVVMLCLRPLDSCPHVLTCPLISTYATWQVCSISCCLIEIANCNELWDPHAVMVWPSLLCPQLMKLHFKWLEGSTVVPSGSGARLAWAVLIARHWDIMAFHPYYNLKSGQIEGSSFTGYFSKQLKQEGNLWQAGSRTWCLEGASSSCQFFPLIVWAHPSGNWPTGSEITQN